MRRSLLPAALSALLLAACGASPNEVVRLPDGRLKTELHHVAAEHCRRQDARARFVGKAPAEAGVLFECVKP